MANKKYCEINLKKVINSENEEYVVKESDIHEGFWCPHQYHTFFDNLDDFARWKQYLKDNSSDKTLECSTFDRYCDLNDIKYEAFPFEEYVTEEDIKNKVSSYQYVWNSDKDSITPTSIMANSKTFCTERLGIIQGKYILVWSDLHQYNRQIPIVILGDIKGIEIK